MVNEIEGFSVGGGRVGRDETKATNRGDAETQRGNGMRPMGLMRPMDAGRRDKEFLRADAEGANRPGADSIVSMVAHRGGGGFPAGAILAGLADSQS